MAKANLEFVKFEESGVIIIMDNLNDIMKRYDTTDKNFSFLCLITAAREALKDPTCSEIKYIIFDVSGLELSLEDDCLLEMADIKKILKERDGDLLFCNIPLNKQSSFASLADTIYNNVAGALAVNAV